MTWNDFQNNILSGERETYLMYDYNKKIKCSMTHQYAKPEIYVPKNIKNTCKSHKSVTTIVGHFLWTTKDIIHEESGFQRTKINRTHTKFHSMSNKSKYKDGIPYTEAVRLLGLQKFM